MVLHHFNNDDVKRPKCKRLFTQIAYWTHSSRSVKSLELNLGLDVWRTIANTYVQENLFMKTKYYELFVILLDAICLIYALRYTRYNIDTIIKKKKKLS